MNIALFGGSFDPFHIGHEKIVQSIFEHLDINRLFIVPTYINPFKEKYFLDPEVRFKLLDELFGNDENIDILKYEINQKRKVPTIETLEYLVSKYDLDTIYLIIGADNFKSIEKWNSFDNLKKMVTFVVFGRDDFEFNKDIKHIFIPFNINISSTEIRKTQNLSLIPEKLQIRMKKLWKKE